MGNSEREDGGSGYPGLVLRMPVFYRPEDFGVFSVKYM